MVLLNSEDTAAIGGRFVKVALSA